MLSLFGRDEVIRNVYRLAQVERPGTTLTNTTDLRSIYLDFLDRRQRGVITNRDEGFFIENEQLEDIYTAAFTEGALNDLNQADVVGSPYNSDMRLMKSEFARQALVDLLNLNDDLALVFSLVIHSVFVRPSKSAEGISGSYGGSSSASIGAIWLTVDDRVSPLDIMEMYVHELTHHLLFIDELNHPQFNYKSIAQKENFARSAILRKLRPLDKVIHSIVVTAELVEARRTFLGNTGMTIIHPASEVLVSDGLRAVDSVNALSNIKELITPHMADVIERCRLVFKMNGA